MTTPLASRNLLVAGSMVAAAPAVVVGAYLFGVAGGDDAAAAVRAIAAAHARFVAGGLLLTAGTFLLIPATLGLLRLAAGRGRPVAVTGAVMSGIAAAVLGGGTLMRTVIFGFLTPSHADVATRVQQLAGSSGLATLPFLFAPLLVIGLVLTGIGLFIGGLRPRWLPIALAVSAVLLHFAPDSAIGSLLHAPLMLCIAGLGAVLLRGSATGAATPPAVAVPEAV
jgi:hypothetical protein